jgi:hypothetical protein
MANMNRCRVALTGVAGLPGVATHYFDTSVTDVSPIRVFWDSVKSAFPTSMQIQVANSGDTIDASNGNIVGAWSGPAQTVVAGSGGAGSYTSTAGIVVEWICPDPINGRRPLGKTYLVPCMAALFDSSGTIANTTVTTFQAAGLALVQGLGGGGALKVWHRPKNGVGGSAAAVSNCRVPDKQVILRSRRA